MADGGIGGEWGMGGGVMCQLGGWACGVWVLNGECVSWRWGDLVEGGMLMWECVL